MIRFQLFITLLMMILSGNTAFTQSTKKTTGVYSQFPTAITPVNSPVIAKLLAQNPQYFKSIVDSIGQNKLQIIYTQIQRNKKGEASFTHHFYNVSDNYFYPASTVKLAAAVVALEKINTLKIEGLNKNTTMLTDSVRVGEIPVFNDPSAESGNPTIAQYIKRILLVSDNEAYNRLYEFIGQEALNKRLQSLGFIDAQLLHRLSISLSETENRQTNPIRFTDSLGNTIYSQPMATSQLLYAKRNDKVGKGYMTGGSFYAGEKLVNEPMDFNKKNRWRLPYIHQLVQWIMFPESQPKNSKLNLTPEDYVFLKKYMSMTPPESNYPNYDNKEFYPAYVKFLLLGSQKGPWPNADLKIYNKVGDAYGFLIDGAYITHEKEGIEFILSAMLYCNSDNILNDDKYDYDSVGFPFMKNLGEVVYAFEKERKKK